MTLTTVYVPVLYNILKFLIQHKTNLHIPFKDSSYGFCYQSQVKVHGVVGSRVAQQQVKLSV